MSFQKCVISLTVWYHLREQALKYFPDFAGKISNEWLSIFSIFNQSYISIQHIHDKYIS